MMKLSGTSIVSVILLLSSCREHKMGVQQKATDSITLNNFQFTAAYDKEWTALFTRNAGWFGGDGIFCLTTSGNEQPGAARKEETLIWFSDSMIGDIKDSILQPGYTMINNSIAIVKNGRPDSTTTRFIWDKTPGGAPQSIFIPHTPATKTGDYYWLGDGFVNHQKNGDLYLFGYRVRNTDPGAAFGFKEVGNTLIIIPAGSVSPFPDKRQLDIPFFLNRDTDTTGSFGAAVLVNTKEAGAVKPDGYIYIYGVRGKNKEVMVARVLPQDIESFDQWTFWNGKDWMNDIHAIQPVTNRVSNEISVTPLPDGRYVMIFQEDGIGKYVSLRLGASPSGPFGPIIHIMDVSNDLEQDKDIFPYNAKAHPVLSDPGELLISYNVNSFDFFKDIKVFPHLYRPRFIRLKYDL